MANTKKENWVGEDTPSIVKSKAQRTLDKVKKERRKKKFKLVKVDAKTYKEVEITDE